MPVMQPTDSNFERTFADLAFVRLKDKAPTLLDHLVGFQLVDKNDEETHAVGVFGFKIGEDWVYAPVFFINGELKGYELLYLKSQDAFVPLTEEWVNYILNRKPSILGEGEPRKVTQLGIRPPDFDVFSRPPYIGSKYASADRKPLKDRMRKWAHPFLDVFAVSPDDEIYSSVKKSFSLPIALKRLGEKAATCLFKTMEENPRFAEAVLRFYKEADLATFAKAAAAYTKEEAGYTEGSVMRQCKECSNYRGGMCSTVKGDVSPSASCKYWAAQLGKNAEKSEDKLPFDEVGGERVPDKVPVVVIRGDDASSLTSDMTDGDREKLMRDNYVVHDPRKPEEKTRAYKSQMAAQLSSPMENGTYMVLGPGGEHKEVIILRDMTKVGLSRPESGVQFVAVIDPKTKAMGKYYSSDLLAMEKTGPLEDLEGLSDPADAQPEDNIFLVGVKGNRATNPFVVSRIDTDSEGVTTLDVHSCYISMASSASSALKSPMNNDYPNDSTREGDMSRIEGIVLTGKEGDAWKQVGNALYVPKGVKAYRTYRMPASEKKNRPICTDEKPALELATSSDILFQLSKAAAENRGIAQMQLWTSGGSYWTRVNGGNGPLLTKVGMVKHLIEDWGLGEESTVGLLDEVKPRESQTVWLKSAQEYTGVMSPSFQEPPVGQESWSRSQVQYPMTDIQNLENSSQMGNEAFYRDMGPMEEEPQLAAMRASDQGQKEILDTSVISGIVKLMDVDTRVDSYIGDLLLGLDRLGRILFMYYWHNDKFSERYGQEDMAKLEDSLRNVFSSLGELTLFLKQKTIDAETMDSEAELTSVIQ